MMILTALVMSSVMWAQNVFTVVYATSDDGFVNVRKRPSTSAPVISKVWMFSHGLGNGVLRGQSGNWSKVSVGNDTGWAYTKYLGTLNWYKNDGRPRLVANKTQTPIFVESMEDGSKHPLFTTVPKGTIIADDFTEDGGYYMLMTAHDNLFIRKSDAIIVGR